MSVREYRAARREVTRVEEAIVKMKDELEGKIKGYRDDIVESERELSEGEKTVSFLQKQLPDIFMTKVDNEMVFRLIKNQKIQIIEITEE